MEMKKEDIKKEDMILNHGLLITVFTVIYFIFQQFIYPFVYIILVLTIVTLGDKISKILPFLEMSETAEDIFVSITFLFCLLIVAVVSYFLGKWTEKELKRINKFIFGFIIIAILIYFIYRYFTEKEDPYAIILPSFKMVYLYCGIMHIIFSIGLLFGKQIEKLVNKLKDYIKSKMKIEKNK